MFIRASTVLFSVAALAGIAVAGGSSQCDTGSLQCCNSVQESNAFIDELFGILNLPLPAAGTQVGLTCSPLTTVGLGSGSACTQQPACCNGNTFNGIVTTGCSPTTINV